MSVSFNLRWLNRSRVDLLSPLLVDIDTVRICADEPGSASAASLLTRASVVLARWY